MTFHGHYRKIYIKLTFTQPVFKLIMTKVKKLFDFVEMTIRSIRFDTNKPIVQILEE